MRSTKSGEVGRWSVTHVRLSYDCRRNALGRSQVITDWITLIVRATWDFWRLFDSRHTWEDRTKPLRSTHGCRKVNVRTSYVELTSLTTLTTVVRLSWDCPAASSRQSHVNPRSFSRASCYWNFGRTSDRLGRTIDFWNYMHFSISFTDYPLYNCHIFLYLIISSIWWLINLFVTEERLLLLKIACFL